MKQRWAMFAMGAWLAGTLIVSVIAAENFYTIDRLLAGSPNAGFASAVSRLGEPQTRELLRYLSSELNRLYFQVWNVSQLVIGGLVLWLVASNRSAVRPRWGVTAMLALVAMMTLWLTPQIVSVGRSLDFVPRNPPPSALGRFWVLHGTYTLVESGKLVLGVIVAIWIARTGPGLAIDAPQETKNGAAA